jgi:hypothetical protein
MITKLLFTAGIILIVLFGWKFVGQIANGAARAGTDDDAPEPPAKRLGKAERRAEDLEWDEASRSYRPRKGAND